MTEAEWLTCTDVEALLEFLQGRASDRKLRLFAVACCRSNWPRFISIRSRRAVEVSELYADGRAERKAMIAAGKDAHTATHSACSRRPLPVWMRVAAPFTAARQCAISGAWDAALTTWLRARNIGKNDRIKDPQADQSEARLLSLLRDIFSNPFNPITPAATWLAWNEGTVPKLAQMIYEDRAFDRLPILADALEEAGCDKQEILDHCRSAGEHVRGCWVVDLILGKS